MTRAYLINTSTIKKFVKQSIVSGLAMYQTIKYLPAATINIPYSV